MNTGASANRPRIAHVISARGIGGAERFLAALVAYGDERGWEQLVLNPFAVDASGGLTALCDRVPVEARPCDTPLQLVPTRKWLATRLAAFRPDVVHCMLFHALVVMATVPRRQGTPRVVTNVYGDWVNIAPHTNVIRPVDRWAGRRADRTVGISESVRRFLVDDYGYPPDSVGCIPLGWQGTPQAPTVGRRPPTVVCVGGLRPEKGHDVLLAALSEVRKDVPAARLVVVGDGDRRPFLEAQVDAAGMGDAVDFVGAAPDVWPYLADADVFASASRSEAFGIAITEAMAAGLPVVAPDVGAIPELVRPGVTGELFPAGDHVALAAHLVRLLRSPELRAQMGAASRLAADDLRMEKVVARYFAVFAEMRGRGGGHPARRIVL